MAIDAIPRYPMLPLMHASIPPFAVLSSFSFLRFVWLLLLLVPLVHSNIICTDRTPITLPLPHRDIRVRATFHQRLVVTWRMWPMEELKLTLARELQAEFHTPREKEPHSGGAATSEAVNEPRAAQSITRFTNTFRHTGKELAAMTASH